jgi:large subunit ribosomal protein L10
VAPEGILTREEKQQEIERLQAELSKALGVFLMNFEKIPVAEDWELRRQVRAAGGRYRVVKNTLSEIGGKGTPAEALMQSLSGPTAMASTETNPVSLAKALAAYAKVNPNFTFRSGWVEGRVISLAEISELVQLPGRGELLAKIMYLTGSPARGVASAMQSVISGLARALDQAVKENKLQPSS